MKTDRMRSFGATLVIGLALATLASACGEPPDDVTSASTELTFNNQPGSSSPWLYDGGTQCINSRGPSFHCCPSGMAMVGAHLGKNVFKCAIVHNGLTDYYTEYDNQRNGMLSCKSGYVMAGYYGGGCTDWTCFTEWRENLYCARPLDGLTFEYVDSGTQDSYPMHVCRADVTDPFRYAMTGIHAGKNLFECDR